MGQPREVSAALESARGHLRHAGSDPLIGVAGAGTIENLREALADLLEVAVAQQAELKRLGVTVQLTSGGY